MSSWGERIRDRRTELGLSIAQLARACKLSPPSVHDWESGKTKMIDGANLIAVAHALQVSPEWLMTGRPNSAAGSASQPTRLDADVLRIAAETACAIAGRSIDLARDAELLALVYDRLVDLAGAPIPPAVIVELTRNAERLVHDTGQEAVPGESAARRTGHSGRRRAR